MKLSNGTKVDSRKAFNIGTVLGGMIRNERILLFGLREKCLDKNYDLGKNGTERLRELGLCDAEGDIDPDARNIVTCIVKGDSSETLELGSMGDAGSQVSSSM